MSTKMPTIDFDTPDVEASEVQELTVKSIRNLLIERSCEVFPMKKGSRRQSPRWSFPGTVQLWLTSNDGAEEQVFASSINLSTYGVGILHDDELPLGKALSIAIHEPERSLQGCAIPRHCTNTGNGFYIGLEFVFEKT